jgi:hypothetical protein
VKIEAGQGRAAALKIFLRDTAVRDVLEQAAPLVFVVKNPRLYG